ncbi:hypothetical protein ADUPG1_003995, partial [Aduncisulcus paluster]
MIARNAIRDIEILAHKLAGAAGNLRVQQVQKPAKELELAVREDKITDDLLKNFEESLSKYIETVKVLEEPEQTFEAVAYDAEAVDKVLGEIEALISSSDVVDEGLVVEIERLLTGNVDQMVVSELKNSLQGFDYRKAEKQLRKFVAIWIQNILKIKYVVSMKDNES